METSKKITWTFIIFYICQIIFIMFANIKYKYDLSPLLNYTTPLVSIILVSYFGKSGVENYTKITNSLCQTTQATDNTTTDTTNTEIQSTESNNQ